MKKTTALILLALLATGCVRPAAPPPPPEECPCCEEAPPQPGPPGWTLEAGRGEGLDLGRPFVTLDDPFTVLLNLPGVRDYAVLEVRREGGVLHIVTDLPDGPVTWGRSPCLLEWPYGNNFKVLRLASPAPRGTSCRLLAAGGRELEVVVSLAGAAQAACDHAGAALGWPNASYLAFFEKFEGLLYPEGLHYEMYFDGAVLSRDGTYTVSGWYLVDARTGAVAESNLHVFPLAGTRHLVAGGDFLTWLDDATTLVLVRREELRLEGVDTTGGVIFSHPVEVEAGRFLGLTGGGTAACFREEGGHISIDLRSGLARRAAGEPVDLHPPGEAGPLDIVSRDGQVVTVAAGGQAVAIDAGALGDFSGLRWGAWSEATGKLYFSAGIEGPSYGMWAEYRLWELDAATGRIREVTAMPGPGFHLAPGGHWAVYRYGGNSSLVDLVYGN